MKHVLSKMSLPNVWEKVFSTEYDARQELISHICGTCLNGDIDYINEDGLIVYEPCGEPVNQGDIYDVLNTACGCEYDYVEFE